MIRGRSVSKVEQCRQSLCALCAHRLGAAQLPSHLQRRFLQSSRPASRPPFGEPALKEDQPRSDDSTQLSSGSSWGKTAAKALGPSSSSSWGSSAPGKGVPPATGWGRPGSAIPLRSGAVAVDTSNDPPKPVELLPHEQRARDLLVERSRIEQMRHVKVHAGPGPQSNRAGRPEPQRRNGLEHIAQAREIVQNLQNRAPISQGGSYPTSRRFAFRREMDDDNLTIPESAPSGSNTSQSWTGLRKRTIEPLPARDEFTEARLRREEHSRQRQYIPLRERSVREPSEYRFSVSKAQPNFAPQPMTRSNDLDHDPFAWKSRPYKNLDLSSTINEKDLAPELQTIYKPLGPSEASRKADSIDDKPTAESWKAREVEKRAEEDDDEPAYTSRPRRLKQPKAPSRFELESMPRGKERDKAKRRQRFGHDEEEDGEEEAQALSKQALKEQRKREKAARTAAKPVPVLLPEYISVANLAVALRVRFEDFIEKLYEMGFEDVAHDHILNSENAGLIAMEFNFEPILDLGDSENLKARPPPEDPSVLPQRPPVVTIMGHVDHGKTTLLDWLRKSSVAAGEHGGITQHIGAFSVPMPGGKLITFLDTPGHAAFLSMRQRGANVTDIVILVVAADDSVKPQTIEAINHAKAAKVPVIVAINKIDKEGCNIDKVKQDLSRHGVEIEDYGGDTQVVCVSGKTGQGMEELEEAAVTLSEMIDMRAETDGPAEGWIIEASIKSIGKAATVLVKRGTLRTGDFIVAGKTWARIRTLRNEGGVVISEAGPGTPVEIDGWKDMPEAGDEVLQAPDEAKAKAVMDYRLEVEERNKMAEDMEAINEFRKGVDEARERIKAEALRAAEAEAAGLEAESLPDTKAHSGPKQIYFIVKGDVSGSVEAVVDSISGIGNGEVQPHILRSGVGQLNEFDIEHAAAAKGHVINFNTEVDESVASLAKYAKVGIIDNKVIYRLVDDVKAKLSEYLPPLITQRVLGEAEIAQVFEITIKGRTTKSVAGCKVRNGLISRNANIRVLRNGENVFDGKLASLKNKKKDEIDMRKGMECGIGFENWYDFQVGDQVQCYEEKQEKRYL